MHSFVLTLHIILCCLLVFIILMQPGKGADPSSAFGGGASSQLFGASGPGNLLTRGTGLIATLFMVTSITLAYQSTRANQTGGGIEGGFEDVLDDGAAGTGFGTPPPAPSGDPAIPEPVPPADPVPADAPPAPAPEQAIPAPANP
jgi:preprotein translocase subunit SecG